MNQILETAAVHRKGFDAASAAAAFFGVFLVARRVGSASVSDVHPVVRDAAIQIVVVHGLGAAACERHTVLVVLGRVGVAVNEEAALGVLTEKLNVLFKK